MSLAQALLAEFEQEARITRKFLERLPEDRLTWKPHPKSMTAGQLALHLAQVPAGVIAMAQQNPGTPPNFGGGAPQPSSLSEILSSLEHSVSFAREALPKWDDAAMSEKWALAVKGQELFSMPRGALLRMLVFSHWIQHRGQFSVYLRLLDVSVPSSYGPSADELPEFMQQKQSA